MTTVPAQSIDAMAAELGRILREGFEEQRRAEGERLRWVSTSLCYAEIHKRTVAATFGAHYPWPLEAPDWALALTPRSDN